MHEHVGTDQCHALLLQDPFCFLPVSEHYLDLFIVFQKAAACGSGGISVDRSTALVRHSDGGEERPLIAGIHFDRSEIKTCLLFHFPDGTFPEALTLFHKASGEFIDIVINAVPVLADQHDLIRILTV